VSEVRGHYTGEAKLIYGDVVALITVDLTVIQAVVPAPSITNPDQVALGRIAWYGRITGGELDSEAAMTAGHCVLLLPTGREGRVKVEGTLLLGSGPAPVDPDLG
jgi:hypothetical protein